MFQVAVLKQVLVQIYPAILELVTAAKNINVGSVQLFLRYFQYPERSVHNMDKKTYHRKL